MKIVNYSSARKRLREVLDECEKTKEPVCVVSRNNQMIIISKDQYEMMINQINGDK